MPANLTQEYLNAERKYHEATTIEEKIIALKQMISLLPKHKGTEKLHAQLKQRLVKLQKESEKRKRSGSGPSFNVKKEGFQILIIGPPNSGKSTLLKKLTNAEPEISPVPFTTRRPVPGIMIPGVQLVEIPAITKNNRGLVVSAISACDGVIVLGNGEYKELAEFLGKRVMEVDINEDAETLREKILQFFGLIRVYTKEPGKEPDMSKPLIMKKGATVLDVAKEIHKDLYKNLKYARVWGSTRFPGQRVEKEYTLQDGDVVELHA